MADKRTRKTRRQRQAGSPNGDRKKRLKFLTSADTVAHPETQSNGKLHLTKEHATSVTTPVSRKASKQRRRLLRVEDSMPDLEFSSPEYARLSDTSFTSNGSGDNDVEGARPFGKLPRKEKKRAGKRRSIEKSSGAASLNLMRARPVSTKHSAKSREACTTTNLSKGRDGSKASGGVTKGTSGGGGGGRGGGGDDDLFGSVIEADPATTQRAPSVPQEGGRRPKLKKGKSNDAWHGEPEGEGGGIGRGEQEHGPQRLRGGPLPNAGKSNKFASSGVPGGAERARASSKLSATSKVKLAGKVATESRSEKWRASGGSSSHEGSNKMGKKCKASEGEGESGTPVAIALTSSKVGYERVSHYIGVRRKISNGKFFLWVNDKLHDGVPYDR